ncbi:hypothetical protein [Microbacterium sp. NPDC058345]
MENPAPFVIMMVTLPALLVAVITSVNAKRTNALWRARREARAQAEAAAK